MLFLHCGWNIRWNYEHDVLHDSVTASRISLMDRQSLIYVINSLARSRTMMTLSHLENLEKTLNNNRAFSFKLKVSPTFVIQL